MAAANPAGDHVDAEVVVVAVGAVNTPLPLHRSGLGSQALGRYLTSHPVLFPQLVLDECLCRGHGYDIFPRLQLPLAIRSVDHALRQ
ncbi:MAG TPA: GMC family oxidoreductase N-terminal domain-containing protein [Mycobacterium sp.]